MLNKAQLLIEIVIGIFVLVVLSLIFFLIFSTIPRSLIYSEDSLIMYNFFLNYLNILNGISREKFSILDNLSDNINYYLKPTSTGFEIKEGKDVLDIRGEKYYAWFRILDTTFEDDSAKKLLEVHLQSPSFSYKSPLILVNVKERTIFQDEWIISTTSIIDLDIATTINQYSTKSENIYINGEVYLP